MIKLKDLLTEKQVGPSWIDGKWYPAHTKSVLNYVRRKEYIPLTPAVVEKALGKKIPVKSFHITGPDGIRQLKNVLGRKKSISTFTATHEDESLAKGRGVQTGMGGVICYVEGHLLAKRSMDFDTTPDKQGRRWVSAFHVFDGKPEIWAKALKASKVDFDSIDGKLSNIERDYKDKWIEGDIKYDDYKAKVKEEQGPLVAKYVKDFIDVANKTLLKHKKLFKKSLIDSDHNKRTAWWNEILVYNTKIIDVFILDRLMGKNAWKITGELKKLVPESKWTVGNPAKYRKWFTERDGKIWKDLK